MFSNIISYFSRPNDDSSNSLDTRKKKNETDDWVFIDKSGCEISKEAVDLEDSEDDNDNEFHIKPIIPVLDLSSLASSSSLVDTLSFTNPEDAWCITPPPCFTLNCPTKLEISPLENLLIEHPSMSVYSLVQHDVLPIIDFTKSKSMEVFTVVDRAVQTEDENSEQKCLSLPHEIKDQSIGSDIGSGNMLWKNAVILSYDKTKKYKGSLELIGKFKPPEYTSFNKDRYKLRPSYIRRQNLHTLSFSSLGSRNRFTVKPFGEKCKRSL